MKPSHAANDNLIEQTRQVWKTRFGPDLTDDDARKITLNVTGFFSVLAEWSRAEQLAAANDDEALAKPSSGEVSHER